MKTIYVVWRGDELPIGWFESEWDARRFGKGEDVEGKNCKVTTENNSGSDHFPACRVYVEPASDHGKANDELAREHNRAIERARAAGLSEDDIFAIQITGRG